MLLKFFHAFREATKGIPLGNIYNIDETGFQIGVIARAWVLMDASSGTMPYRTNPGCQK